VAEGEELGDLELMDWVVGHSFLSLWVFREIEAYIQAPEQQSLVEDFSLEGDLSISARQRSLAADFR
jgi:hypothetical protein